MKSSPEKIDAANTKRLELLEAKLGTVDPFDIDANNCQPNRDLVGKGKNIILKKMYLLVEK